MNFHGKLGLGKIPKFQSNQVQFIPHLMTPFSLVEMTSPVFTCGEACKSRDDKKSVGGGAGVVVCPELLSKEEVELWFCPELLSKTLVNGKMMPKAHLMTWKAFDSAQRSN